MTILYAIIALGVLIFVHELGHFLVAKAFNVKVEKFSIGFGKKLIGKQIGETEYLLSAFPLGGYVKMFGESGLIEGEDINEDGEAVIPKEMSDEDKKRSFHHKPPLARIAIVVAGPVFNLVFAWIAFILLTMSGVPTVTAKVGDIIQDKPAARAGIQKNDLVTSINNQPVKRWDDLTRFVTESNGQPLNITLNRQGKEIKVSVTPETMASKTIFGEKTNRYAIGVKSSSDIVTEHYSVAESFVKGTKQTGTVIELTVMSLVKLVQRVVPLDNVGGPIMIVKMAGEQAAAGGANFLAFMALLSINLGVLNLLPVPVLDGGHLFFYIIELVIGRPVRQEFRERAQQIGMFLLLSLMALAFYNDIVRYFVKSQG